LESSIQSPLERFLRRLLQRSSLNLEEQRAVLALTGEPRRYPARTDIVSPGERVDHACLVTRGLAGRFDQMLDGQRQITSFYIAGDMSDLHSVVAPRAPWAITAVSEANILRVPHRQLREIAIRYPAIAMAFWRDGTVDASIFSKWVGNLGRKNAKARIAHVFCEMGIRTEAAQLGTRSSFHLGATQEQLAEAVGITTVHMNRVLQDIRGDGLLTFRSGRVEVSDWHTLALVAEFDPAYLMLDGPPLRGISADAGTPAMAD
jgi:CRP-like cAMP-binding protein